MVGKQESVLVRLRREDKYSQSRQGSEVLMCKAKSEVGQDS